MEEWFSRITDYGRSKAVKVDHYIVSSGNAEIIEGTRISGEFTKIYASRFFYDHNGVACWPAQAVNFTTKTQFIFRINKGAHDLSDDKVINKFVEMKDRPVPFENMIYIGDGDTDIPCFRLVNDLGGLAVAVYAKNTSQARSKAEALVKDGRVHGVAPADYSQDTALDTIVKAQIDHVAARASRDRTLRY